MSWAELCIAGSHQPALTWQWLELGGCLLKRGKEPCVLRIPLLPTVLHMAASSTGTSPPTPTPSVPPSQRTPDQSRWQYQAHYTQTTHKNHCFHLNVPIIRGSWRSQRWQRRWWLPAVSLEGLFHRERLQVLGTCGKDPTRGKREHAGKQKGHWGRWASNEKVSTSSQDSWVWHFKLNYKRH